ncbi:hypothetical protein QBC47DRAFT_90952 [Echria macrotheca]|uniref:Uncharacterized protein n=1 Tax=Echria macrotheca TaxID=438768 RepID=A0AAJ0B5N4_9PEZI|nr:hypothetical protein QBC47DRAFT_90952 [Echria macrotheca]
MANTQPPPAKDKLQEEEERLQDAFDHINELHLQLRQLRTALPRIVAPLSAKSAKNASPQAVHAAVMKAAQDTSNQITDLRNAFTSDKTVAIFREAAESRKKEPKGIRPWLACEDPNWAQVKKGRQPADPATESTRAAAAVSSTTGNNS